LLPSGFEHEKFNFFKLVLSKKHHMLQCTKGGSFDANLLTWVTKSVV